MAGTSIGLNAMIHGPLPPALRMPISVATSAAMSGVAARSGAGLDSQALCPENAGRGALYGGLSAIPIAFGLALALRHGRSRDFYHNQRLQEMTPAQAAFEVLLRIPIGTALTEEVIFRGALLGTLSLHHSQRTAVAVSSLLFGLSHIAPELRRHSQGYPSGKRAPGQTIGLAAGTVVFTTGAGMFLAWLRHRSGSLVAPWIAHTAANAFGFGGAWLASRRIDSRETSRIRY